MGFPMALGILGKIQDDYDNINTKYSDIGIFLKYHAKTACLLVNKD